MERAGRAVDRHQQLISPVLFGPVRARGGVQCEPVSELDVTASPLVGTEDAVMVALPPDHPLATRHALRLQDLMDARWIDAPNVAAPLAEIRRHAGTAGFRPAFHYAGQDMTTLIQLAAHGHGLTLLPQQSLSRQGIAAVRIATPRLGLRMELIHTALPKNSPAAALAVILSRPD